MTRSGRLAPDPGPSWPRPPAGRAPGGRADASSSALGELGGRQQSSATDRQPGSAAEPARPVTNCALGWAFLSVRWFSW